MFHSWVVALFQTGHLNVLHLLLLLVDVGRGFSSFRAVRCDFGRRVFCGGWGVKVWVSLLIAVTVFEHADFKLPKEPRCGAQGAAAYRGL